MLTELDAILFDDLYLANLLVYAISSVKGLCNLTSDSVILLVLWLVVGIGLIELLRLLHSQWVPVLIVRLRLHLLVCRTSTRPLRLVFRLAGVVLSVLSCTRIIPFIFNIAIILAKILIAAERRETLLV